MTLIVKNGKLRGVKTITPLTIFEDFRGNYVESYNEPAYKESGINHHFVQDDFATSRKHVLRGMHGDEKTVKLVSCPYGTLYVVIVNNDPQSSQYREWESFTLNDVNKTQILVPEKFGVGYLVMSEIGIFHYKQTTVYGEVKQFTVKWNDPAYNIWWPIENPIRSERDF